MKDHDYTLTFPFAHHPFGVYDDADLPDWVRKWGYDGQSGGRNFRAAGVMLHFHVNTINVAEVQLSNLTTRGVPAKHMLVMPPAVMDEIASGWLIGRSLFWRRILAQGIKGLGVETVVPYAKSDGTTVPERTKGVITETLAAPYADLILAWVDFGEAGVDSVTLTALLDPDQFRLSHEV